MREYFEHDCTLFSPYILYDIVIAMFCNAANEK